MCDPATAILGAGAAQGITGLIGGGISAGAASGAAATQAAATREAAQLQYQAEQQAINAQMGQFEQIQSNLAPYMNIGQYGWNLLGSGVMNNLQAPVTPALKPYNLTVPYPAPFTGPTDLAALAQTPGYQFTLQQGLQAAQNSAAAQGLGRSGAAVKGAVNYAEGLAGTTWNQVFQNQLAGYQQNLNRALGANTLGFQQTQAANQQALAAGQLTLSQQGQRYNMLTGLVDIGAQAATHQGQFGTQVATNVGNIAQGAATNIGGAITSGAAAQAAGQVGVANALTGTLGSAAGAGTNTALLLALNNAGLFGGTGPVSGGFNPATAPFDQSFAAG